MDMISSIINGYSISPSINDIICKINDDCASLNNPSTASYYGMKLISEIDRLNKMLFTYPITIQMDIKNTISKLEEAVAVLQDKIKEKHGDCAIYFSDLSNDESIRNHPFVRILSGFRDRGFSIDAAIDMTANVVGVPEYQIKSYTEKYKIDYPEISVSTKEYILGQEDAKSLAATGVGRHSNVADAMYEKQMKYLSRNNDFDAKSYLAGMCHMCVFSQNDLDKLREEGRVLSYKTKL